MLQKKFVSFVNPIVIQKISQAIFVRKVDMTKKSRYPAYFSKNIVIYLYDLDL
jgi:hypothetical protein